jgi:hypothetical protein
MAFCKIDPDLRKELLKDFSKANTVRIVGLIGRDQVLFDQLILLVLEEEELIAARAAWVLRHSYEQHPDLIHRKHINAFVHRLTKPACDAVKRNLTAVLQYEHIPSSCEGMLVDRCFQLLNARTEAVAIKVHAMSILYKMSARYPDLRNELAGAIQNQMPLGSAGFRNKGSKILKALGNLQDL